MTRVLCDSVRWSPTLNTAMPSGSSPNMETLGYVTVIIIASVTNFITHVYVVCPLLRQSQYYVITVSWHSSIYDYLTSVVVFDIIDLVWRVGGFSARLKQNILRLSMSYWAYMPKLLFLVDWGDLWPIQRQRGKKTLKKVKKGPKNVKNENVEKRKTFFSHNP